MLHSTPLKYSIRKQQKIHSKNRADFFMNEASERNDEQNGTNGRADGENGIAK